MWTSILGALSIVAVIIVSVIALRTVPTLIDAVGHRIRGAGPTTARSPQPAGASTAEASTAGPTTAAPAVAAP